MTDCIKLNKCDHCHAIGHVKEDCCQLIGYPDNVKGKKKVNAVFARGCLCPYQSTTGGGTPTSSSMQEQTVRT